MPSKGGGFISWPARSGHLTHSSNRNHFFFFFLEQQKKSKELLTGCGQKNQERAHNDGSDSAAREDVRAAGVDGRDAIAEWSVYIFDDGADHFSRFGFRPWDAFLLRQGPADGHHSWHGQTRIFAAGHRRHWIGFIHSGWRVWMFWINGVDDSGDRRGTLIYYDHRRFVTVVRCCVCCRRRAGRIIGKIFFVTDYMLLLCCCGSSRRCSNGCIGLLLFWLDRFIMKNWLGRRWLRGW